MIIKWWCTILVERNSSVSFMSLPKLYNSTTMCVMLTILCWWEIWRLFSGDLISADYPLVLSMTHIATLGLRLEFSAKQKILQIPACKMEQRSGYIMQLEPPTHPPDQLEIRSMQDGDTKWLYYAAGTHPLTHRISWKSEACKMETPSRVSEGLGGSGGSKRVQ